MRRGALVVALAAAAFGGAMLAREAQTPTGTGKVTIDLAVPATPVPSTLYGIFYEEINHAGDGGLQGAG